MVHFLCKASCPIMGSGCLGGFAFRGVGWFGGGCTVLPWGVGDFAFGGGGVVWGWLFGGVGWFGAVVLLCAFGVGLARVSETI